MIAIRQIRELRNPVQKSTAILIYFFCDEKDNRRNNAVVILQALLYQLFCQRLNLIKCWRVEYEKQMKQLLSSPNALQSLWRILEDVLQQCTCETTWLVVDALDECEPESRTILLNHIRSRTNRQREAQIQEKWWFLTSRNDAPIRELSNSSLNISLEARSQQVTADVRNFIDAQVQELQEIKKCGEDLKATIRQTLSRKAKGTFLWVSFACTELRRVPSINAKRVLERLPSGLNAIYEQIVHQVLQNEDENLANHARNILIAVLITSRPLRLKELAVMAALPAEHSKDRVSI